MQIFKMETNLYFLKLIQNIYHWWIRPAVAINCSFAKMIRFSGGNKKEGGARSDNQSLGK